MPAALLLIGLLISKNDENFQLLGGVAPPTPPGRATTGPTIRIFGYYKTFHIFYHNVEIMPKKSLYYHTKVRPSLDQAVKFDSKENFRSVNSGKAEPNSIEFRKAQA